MNKFLMALHRDDLNTRAAFLDERGSTENAEGILVDPSALSVYE